MYNFLKKARNLGRSFGLLFYAVILLCLTSCDPCKDVECFNDGVCNEGDCECTEWYDGANCMDPKIKKYSGWYDMTISCWDGIAGITERLKLIYDDETTMRIGNLVLSFNSSTWPEKFEIEKQYDDQGNIYQGSGEFTTEDLVELSFTVTYTDGSSEYCTLVGTR